MKTDRLKHVLRFCRRHQQLIKSNPLIKLSDVLSGVATLSNVYIAECQGFTKIGHAINPHLRLQEMQLGNPFDIQILGIIPTPTPIKDESTLHSRFKQYRARGEWFKLPQEVQDELVHEAFLRFENFQKLTPV